MLFPMAWQRCCYGRRSHFLIILAFFLFPYIVFFCFVDNDPWSVSRWMKFIFCPEALPKQNCADVLPKIESLRQEALKYQFSSSGAATDPAAADGGGGGSGGATTLLNGPAVIHQTWKTHHLPSRFRLWSKSWKHCFPQWSHQLWSDRENRCLIQEIYPWFLPTYDSYPYNIHRVDAVRYFYMHYFGGLYTDLDNECLRAFPDLLASKQVVLGAMNGTRYFVTASREGYIQNSFMYSTPNHKLWERVFHYLMQRKVGPAEVVTGPIILMMAINDYRASGELQEADLMIYPGYYFNPFSWLNNPFPQECQGLNRMSDMQLKECRNHFSNTSYVIQYHVQSWNLGRANIES